MKFLHITLLLISAKHILVDSMQGGQYFGIKEVPYQAQLYFEIKNGYISYCGATIISEYWLVSAAHCVRNPDIVNFQVRIGTSSTASKGNLINITKIIVHGDYDEIYGYDSDICLVKIATPIEFNEYRQPIPIASEAPKAGDIITISGFGELHFQLWGAALRIGHVPVITPEQCRRNISIVTDNMLCTNATDVDLCFGDSGSPAAFDGKLVGVASQGCEDRTPNVFTKVANFYDWILNHTGIKYSD